MFAFISPSSVRSTWLHFETGFAYAKGIKVVPVGILGVGLDDLRPPLSVLQGFDIGDHEGLNNIIAVLNNVIQSKICRLFTAQEYADLFGAVEAPGDRGLGRFNTLVDRISVSEEILVSGPLELAEEHLRKLSLEVWKDEEGVHTYGLSISFPKSHGGEPRVEMLLDAQLADRNLPLVRPMLQALGSRSEEIGYFLEFEKEVWCLAKNFKKSGALFDAGVQVLGNGQYRFGKIPFTVGRTLGFPKKLTGYLTNHRTILKVNPGPEVLTNLMLIDLLELLFKKGVLYIDGGEAHMSMEPF